MNIIEFSLEEKKFEKIVQNPSIFFFVQWARLGPNSGPGPKIPGPALSSGLNWARDWDLHGPDLRKGKQTKFFFTDITTLV